MRKTGVNPLFFIPLMLLVSCKGVKNHNHKMIDLYVNESVKTINLDAGISKYTAKFTNYSDRPIVISFTYNRWLPIIQAYTGEIKNDSIVNILSTGTSFYRNMGLDTLLSGETQRYFVDISHDAKPTEENPVVLISFEYYYLDDFSKSPFSTDFVQAEYFILMHKKDGICIFKTDLDFVYNQHEYNKHKLPSCR